MIKSSQDSFFVNPAALVTFTEEILNGKRHFLCSVGIVNVDLNHFFPFVKIVLLNYSPFIVPETEKEL